MNIQLLEIKGEVDIKRYKELTDLCGYVWYLYENSKDDKKRYEVLYCENVSKDKYKKYYQFTYYYSPRLNPLIYNENKRIKEMFGKYIVGSKYDGTTSYKYSFSSVGCVMLCGAISDNIVDALKSVEAEIVDKKPYLKSL